MPSNQNDHFDDFDDDDDDGFMTFDARGGDEGMSRGPIILAAVVLLLAAFLATMWVYFNGDKGSKNATPEIASQTEAYKEIPINEVAAPVDDLDKGVYNSIDGAAPPPLEVQATNGVSDDPLLAANQVATPSAIATNTVKPSVPKPAPVAKPATTASVKPATTPTVKPAATTNVAKPTTTASVAAKPAAALAVKPAEVSKPKSTGVSAQLGSFPTKEQADKALAQYRSRGLTGPASISSADLGAKGTWYRIKATGFENRDQALAFCSKAKAAGANCIPAN